MGKSLRNVSVGRRFSVGDLGEDLPYGKAKRSADEMEGGEVFGSFPAKYRSSQRLPSLSAGVSFVCTSAGRVAAKYFCPSNQRPVSPTSSAARRMSPSGESKCCMNVIIYLENIP